MGENPDNKCGYTYPEDHEVGDPPIHQSCCYRESVSEADRCAWHVEPEETDEKTIQALKNARVDAETRNQTSPVGELLDGAVLAGAELGNSISFQGVILRSADLNDANLKGVNLNDANLQLADLNDADLQGANLREADLFDAVLSDADLQGADLNDANLQLADLNDADLLGADLNDTDLREADLNDTNLVGVDLTDTDLTDLRGADLRRADLNDVELRGADLRGADLNDADLQGSDLQGADLQGADLRGADLNDAHLQLADLLGANAHQADFTGVNAQYADFRPSATDPMIPLGSNRSADRTQYTHGGQRFGVSPEALESGVLTSHDIEPIDDTPSPTNLEDAVFENADLRDATLTDARLYQTDLTNVRINAATKFGDEPIETIYERRDDLDGWFTETTDSNYQAGAWVHRRLERLHEENALSEAARKFHVRKQEAERSHHKQALHAAASLAESTSHIGRYLVFSLNGILTKHGESLRRTVGIAGVVILVSAVLYPLPEIGGIASTNEDRVYQYSLDEGVSGNVAMLIRGLYFSVITFSTIGYGDHFPAGPFARTLVGIESLMGAVLIALFIFVLGRRTAR